MKAAQKHMKLWLWIGCFVLSFWAGVPRAVAQDGAAGAGAQSINMVVGQQKVISTSYGIGDISIGSSRAISVTALRDRKEIVIQAVRSGSGSLIIYDTRGVRRDEYDIQVMSEDLQRNLQNIKGLLGDVEGLRYRIVGNQIIIEGEVYLEEEIKRVQVISDKYDNVQAMVTLSPVTQRIIANTIEKEIDRPEIHVRLLRNQLLLEGIVYSESAKVRAEAIARAYSGNVVNVIEVRASERPPSREKTIVLIAHYVNLSKNLLNSWGVQWTPLSTNGTNNSAVDASLEMTWDFASGGGLTADPMKLTSVGSLFLPQITRAKSSGYVRVIENPTVSVKSGEPVKMFAGLQYPYAIVTQMGTSLEWKDIGVSLEATPYAQGDSVDMQIKIEVTELGQISNSNGDPAIDTNRIETRQYCKAGESIVIGGLSRLADSVIYNKQPDAVPGGVIQLFKSKEYNKTKSQFLVFITPQIHETSSTANKEIQEKFNLKEVKQ